VQTPEGQLLDEEVHLVVEVTTNNYRSVEILMDDISDDTSYSLRLIVKVLLLTWLKVAVEN
jgi:hypothetical protein